MKSLLFISLIILSMIVQAAEFDTMEDEQTRCLFEQVNIGGTNFFFSTPQNVATYDEAYMSCRHCLNRSLADVPNSAVRARCPSDREVRSSTRGQILNNRLSGLVAMMEAKLCVGLKFRV